MTDTTPLWLVRHVERESRGARFLNAKEVRRNRWLVNTTEGSAVVSRRGAGEPTFHYLPFPDRRAGMTCSVCDWHMEVVGTDFPVRAYCSNCGTLHELRYDGSAHRIGEPQAVLPPQVVAEADPVLSFPEILDVPEAEHEGPYRHGPYTLHARKVQLKRGGTQTIYFFAKHKPKSGAPCAMPEGYEVGVNTTTGLPYLQKPGHEPKHYEDQCAAVTPEGKQCRNSSRHGSKYCASHASYRPPSRSVAQAAVDTKPRVRRAKDTVPAAASPKRAPASKAYRPQCAAITPEGNQCRNSARQDSKYCGSHKGFRPTPVQGKDTKPRVARAKDTAPARRRT